MMSTFLELAYMVDATQHDGVGWVGGRGVKTREECLKELQRILKI